jgi:hypothetical protein
VCSVIGVIVYSIGRFPPLGLALIREVWRRRAGFCNALAGKNVAIEGYGDAPLPGMK